MSKSLSVGLLFSVVIGIGACLSVDQSVEETETSEQLHMEKAAFDGKNVSFTVDGKFITLVNGVSETPIENSSAKTTTRYFDNEAEGDLNGDGLEDHAFMVTQDAGGSGTFYYVVVALKNNEGYTTTNAFFVGDRIAPESIEIRSDTRDLRVYYTGRKRGEPMTTPPSEGKVLLLKVTPSGVLEGLMK